MFDIGKMSACQPGWYTFKLYLPIMKITHHWQAGGC